MKIENNQWDQAEEDFDSGKTEQQESELALTDILKSAYLVFREKQRNWLDSFCAQALEFTRVKNTEKVKEKNREESQKLENELDIISTDFIKVESRVITYFEDFAEDTEMVIEAADPIEIERARKADNEKIINGILSGDQGVFNKLYQYQFPKVVRFVGQYSGNREKAQDVFQDALLILVEKVHQKDFELTSSVSTYLYSICKNLWMNQFRKEKKTQNISDFGNEHIDDITYISFDTPPDIYDNVSRVIDSMGDPCKQLLECFYYKKLAWDEISNSLGYASAASARNQKYKCLEKIRSSIDFSHN
jgi:RNA polymerase sigma factor (sigma-70 family)